MKLALAVMFTAIAAVPASPQSPPPPGRRLTLASEMIRGYTMLQPRELITHLSDRSIRAANIIVATLPILLVYPFLQRYFIHGIRLGAVKG